MMPTGAAIAPAGPSVVALEWAAMSASAGDPILTEPEAADARRRARTTKEARCPPEMAESETGGGAAVSSMMGPGRSWWSEMVSLEVSHGTRLQAVETGGLGFGGGAGAPCAGLAFRGIWGVVMETGSVRAGSAAVLRNQCFEGSAVVTGGAGSVTVAERSVWKAERVSNEALWCVRARGGLWGPAKWDVYGSQGSWWLRWLQTGLFLSVCRGAGPSARNVCCSSPRDGDGLERAVAAKWKMSSEYIWRRVSQ